MPHRHHLLVIIISTIILSACQAEQKTALAQNTPIATPATIIEKPAPQTTSKPISLEVTQQSLEQLYNDEDQHITADAPTRIIKQMTIEQKTKISGGVLLNEERSMMTDGIKGVDGAEVKISVPLR